MTALPGAIFTRLNLARQYMLASFVILVCCTIGIGWWIGREIEAGVVNETSATTALYMNSFVAPLVQDLATGDEIREKNVARLDALIKETPLGRYVLSFKIWSPEGRVVYSVDRSVMGQTFDIGENAERAWNGAVATEISTLSEDEHAGEKRFGDRLLETYSPIWRADSDEIIAVAEFYQSVEHLDAQIWRTRLYGWLTLGLAALAVYIVLAGIVRRGSDTIVRQQRELGAKVRQLTDLLAENRDLSERVRRAASGTTARNENLLRRISAELHDGPAQALGLAVLRLDAVMEHTSGCSCDKQTLKQANRDLITVQRSVHDALEEIRKLSTGLILPELDELTLQETLQRVVRGHELRSNTKVALDLRSLPEDASLPVKITVYRVVQEALNNAYRHAGGKDQRVEVAQAHGRLIVDVVDGGAGFDPAGLTVGNGRLGLEGMRQRVESMGGVFQVDAAPGRGTRIHAELPRQPGEHEYVH
ncbi:MAG: sensor histidine kinase [Rhodospirillales bacterium]|nr:MAG: sensor histidine kinase [Rhodospirillales bacterium]